MCGIAGIYLKNNNETVEKKLLQQMCNAMRHRGPDDEGYHIDRNIGFCMRRLSVIDLYKGKQPIHNEDKTVWVVFNGEIYNYRELRRSLEGKHYFYTDSDTEVLVHLYEEYGENFVTMLNGMFAFAIWDKRSRILFVARDRLGIKPLYYYEGSNGKFIFASEIKSILKTPYVCREVEVGALDCYFTFLYTPAPLTMFKGIKKLLPGHILILKNGEVNLKQYWNIDYKPEKKKSLKSYSEEFREKLESAVKRQLISDVPLGAFLSGGIDSSAIVAIMSECLQKPIETFSIGYGSEESYYDERDDARQVSERFRTNHHEFELKPDIIELIPRIVEALDEPLADASAIPNFYLSKQTKKHVTVALSGLGGDELCGGYPRYVGMYLTSFYRYIPRFLREKVIYNAVLRLPDSSKGKRFMDRAKRFVKYGDLPFGDAYFNMISSFDRRSKQNLFSSYVNRIKTDLAEAIFNSYFFYHESELLMNRVFFTDLKLYLVDDLLMLADKMSMAHSLEIRVPFLDNEFVEFMATIPPELKVKGVTKKYLFKKSFEGILPKNILSKEKKGFSVPLVLWFRHDLKKFVRHYLSRKKIESIEYFNWNYVESLLNNHFQGKENNFSQIWGILLFCLWHSIYIEGRRIDDEMDAINKIMYDMPPKVRQEL